MFWSEPATQQWSYTSREFQPLNAVQSMFRRVSHSHQNTNAHKRFVGFVFRYWWLGSIFFCCALGLYNHQRFKRRRRRRIIGTNGIEL